MLSILSVKYKAWDDLVCWRNRVYIVPHNMVGNMLRRHYMMGYDKYSKSTYMIRLGETSRGKPFFRALDDTRVILEEYSV